MTIIFILTCIWVEKGLLLSSIENNTLTLTLSLLPDNIQ